LDIFDIFGTAFPSAPIDVKFRKTKRTKVPVGHAKCDLNRCNESPLWGEKPHFWPVSKNNTGSLPLRGIAAILPVKKQKQKQKKTNTTFSHLHPARVVRSSPNFA